VPYPEVGLGELGIDAKLAVPLKHSSFQIGGHLDSWRMWINEDQTGKYAIDCHILISVEKRKKDTK
jgi:hypothetical protein